MGHTHEIISLDSRKVWYEEVSNNPAFKKITTYFEVDRLQYAQNVLKNKFVCVSDRKFEIKLPTIYDWNPVSSIQFSQCPV